MPSATTLSELRALSREELVQLYDQTSTNVVVGLDFLREEIARREVDAQTAEIVKMTRHMRNLTYVITALTLLNVLALLM